MSTIKLYLKNYWWKYIIILIVITLDMVTKGLIVSPNNVSLGSYTPIIGNFIGICPTTNTGAGFSLLEGKIWLLITITFLFIICLAVFDIMYKHNSVLFGFATALIFGGAVGNLIDRLIFGYVRDFICLKSIQFPIFNFADTSLTIGVFLIFIYIIFFAPSDSKKFSSETLVVKSSIDNIENLSKTRDIELEKQIEKQQNIEIAKIKQKEKVKKLKQGKKALLKKKKRKIKKSKLILDKSQISHDIESHDASKYNEDDLYFAVEKERLEKKNARDNK